MSTDVAVRQNGSEPLPEAVEKLLASGDIKDLTPQQRIQFYKSRCEAAGLDPRGRPFEFISMQGKLVLYAKKECAEQLNGMHGISHKILSRNHDKDGCIYEVSVSASMRDGRSTEDIGVVAVGALKGEALANAYMKAITKAKRRATLSLCGLGDVIDESELDTMTNVRAVNEDGSPKKITNGTDFGSGKYAAPEDQEAYLKSIEGYLEKRNQQWLDRWTRPGGEIPEKLAPHLATLAGADDHLVKYAESVGMIAPGSRPEGGIKYNQVGRLASIPFARSTEECNKLKRELKLFLDRQEAITLEALQKHHPELFESEEDNRGDAWEEGVAK